MWEGINKRRFPRANYGCEVIVRHKKKPEIFSTQTENIGVGGICVILPKGLSLFTDVELEIRLPDGKEAIHTEGRTVWIVKDSSRNDRFDTGVEFTKISKEARGRIETIINRLYSSLSI